MSSTPDKGNLITVTGKGIQDSYAQLLIESKTADHKILLGLLVFCYREVLEHRLLYA